MITLRLKPGFWNVRTFLNDGDKGSDNTLLEHMTENTVLETVTTIMKGLRLSSASTSATLVPNCSDTEPTIRSIGYQMTGDPHLITGGTTAPHLLVQANMESTEICLESKDRCTFRLEHG